MSEAEEGTILFRAVTGLRQGQMSVNKNKPFKFLPSATVMDVKKAILPYLSMNGSVEHVHLMFHLEQDDFADANDSELDLFGLEPKSDIEVSALRYDPSIPPSKQPSASSLLFKKMYPFIVKAEYYNNEAQDLAGEEESYDEDCDAENRWRHMTAGLLRDARDHSGGCVTHSPADV
ncbi:hypothetical protein IWW39_000675 [Coemansia spiralis]|uniref:Uncharacterized protein n=1 Tax=Coemansia spiralis TaxID=417178 RepID=A0A9W8L690_9FUNG|nr:hypothetical protein IWW39_000675 [Coemansia spiralis]